MEAIIDHNPEHGGYIQVAHGDSVVSLIVTRTMRGEMHVMR